MIAAIIDTRKPYSIARTHPAGNACQATCPKCIGVRSSAAQRPKASNAPATNVAAMSVHTLNCLVRSDCVDLRFISGIDRHVLGIAPNRARSGRSRLDEFPLRRYAGGPARARA